MGVAGMEVVDTWTVRWPWRPPSAAPKSEQGSGLCPQRAGFRTRSGGWKNVPAGRSDPSNALYGVGVRGRKVRRPAGDRPLEESWGRDRATLRGGREYGRRLSKGPYPVGSIRSEYEEAAGHFEGRRTEDRGRHHRDRRRTSVVRPRPDARAFRPRVLGALCRRPCPAARARLVTGEPGRPGGRASSSRSVEGCLALPRARRSRPPHHGRDQQGRGPLTRPGAAAHPASPKRKQPPSPRTRRRAAGGAPVPIRTRSAP